MCKTHRFLSALTLTLLVGLAACSDTSTTQGGTADPTPTPTAASVPTRASRVLGSQGGTLGAPDNKATVAIPAGALMADANITVDHVAKSLLTPAGATLASDGYDFGPSGTTFAVPATISVAATGTPDTGRQFLLAYFDASQWLPLAGSHYDSSSGIVSASVTHFTTYAVLSVAETISGCSAQQDPNGFCDPQVCDAQTDACITPTGSPNPRRIGGTVSGLRAGTQVTVHNGNDTVVIGYPVSTFSFARQVLEGGGYDVTVVADSNGLDCHIESGSGVVGDANVSVAVSCALNLHFAANQNASLVLGQPDLATNELVGAEPNRLRLPLSAVYLSDGGYFYVPDNDNYRVFGLNRAPTSSTPTADFILGQPDLLSRDAWDPNSPLASSTAPLGISGDANYLVVSDARTSRVLIFSPLPHAMNPNAVVALGQPNLTTGGNSNCTASAFAEPWGSTIVNGKLLVADRFHHRVLIWNSVPQVSGAAADLVLGQPNLTTCEPQSGVDATNLHQPMDVWSDGNRLLVVDRDASRIVAWNTFPIVNNQAADGFLGQVDFTTADGSTDPNVGSNFPQSVASDGTHIFVAEPLRNRVTIWDSFPTSNNTPALIGVLGQADTLGTACNRGDNNAPATANTLCSPTGVAIVGGYLFVTDTENNRVVAYDSQ